MLSVAGQRAARLGRDVDLREGNAQHLSFDDASFDTAVCALSLCTIPSPVAAVGEMRRVLRPGGRLLLLDHIGSTWPPVYAAQWLLERVTIPAAGEHFTRRQMPSASRGGGQAPRRLAADQVGDVAMSGAAQQAGRDRRAGAGRAVHHDRNARTVFPARTSAPVSPTRVVIAAAIVGLVTGFFGVGGGFVVVPALVLALGFDMPTAVGTSLLVIAINSAWALLSRLGTHASIDHTLLITFTAAAVVGAVVGSRIASKVRPERLAVAFAFLMIAVAIYTGDRSLPALV